MNRVGDTLICTGSNKEIIGAFATAGVEYVLIGGLAVAWYCPTRQADDMDLLVNPTPDNSMRISQALGTLSSLSMSCFTKDSFAKVGLRVPLKKFHYAELLTPRKDGPTYSEVLSDSVAGKLFDIPVRIASAASLIKLKEQAVASAEAQRDKHLNDIKLLKEHAV